MANSCNVLFGLFCLFYLVNCFHLDRAQLSKSRFALIIPPLSSQSRAEDDTNKAEEAGRIESSSAPISKFETRSKLLEAALLSSRVRQAEADQTIKNLTEELSDLTLKYDLYDKKTRQTILELENSKSELQTALKTTIADALQVDKIQLQEKKESVGEIMKYKNRLVLLENAYRESQEKTRQLVKASEDEIATLEAVVRSHDEEKLVDLALRENFIESSRKKMSAMKSALNIKEEQVIQLEKLYNDEALLVAELRDDVQRLSEEKESSLQNYLAQEQTIMAERDALEKSIIDLKRLENERRDAEKIQKAQIEMKKTTPSETFSEFFNKNLTEEKVIEQQKLQKKEQDDFLIKQKKDQEDFLAKQKFILEETVRMLVEAAAEKKPRKIEEENFPPSVVDFEEQTRLLKKQVDLLESLTSKLPILSDSLITRTETAVAVEVRDNRDNNRISENNGNREITVSSEEADPPSEFDERGSSSVRVEREMKVEKRVEATQTAAQTVDSVASFFSSIIDDIVAPIADDEMLERKSKVILGSAQQKRVKFARASGRVLRGLGGALAKTATDTLGFWVGLGFDEVVVEGKEEGYRGVESIDDGYDRVYSRYDDERDRKYESGRVSDDVFEMRAGTARKSLPSSLNGDVYIDRLEVDRNEYIGSPIFAEEPLGTFFDDLQKDEKEVSKDGNEERTQSSDDDTTIYNELD